MPTQAPAGSRPTVGAFRISVNAGLFGLRETASGEPHLLAAGAEISAVVFGGPAAIAGLGSSRAR